MITVQFILLNKFQNNNHILQFDNFNQGPKFSARVVRGPERGLECGKKTPRGQNLRKKLTSYNILENFLECWEVATLCLLQQLSHSSHFYIMELCYIKTISA